MSTSRAFLSMNGTIWDPLIPQSPSSFSLSPNCSLCHWMLKTTVEIKADYRTYGQLRHFFLQLTASLAVPAIQCMCKLLNNPFFQCMWSYFSMTWHFSRTIHTIRQLQEASNFPPPRRIMHVTKFCSREVLWSGVDSRTVQNPFVFALMCIFFCSVIIKFFVVNAQGDEIGRNFAYWVTVFLG
jgi:hypothetical protein